VDWQNRTSKRCWNDLLGHGGDFTTGFSGQSWITTNTLPPDCSKKVRHLGYNGNQTTVTTPSTSSKMANHVVSENFYSSLNSDVSIGDVGCQNQQPHGSSNDISSRNGENNLKKIHLPPIILRGQTLPTIVDLLKSLKITNYTIKLMSVGTSIYVQDKSEFSKFKEVLISRNWQFYTYSPSDEKLAKFVLYGLQSITVDDLRNELQHHKINPVDIKPMLMKNQRFDSETLFLLSFKKGEVSLNELRKTKALFQIIIRWDHYTRKQQGPVQCSAKCMDTRPTTVTCHQNASNAVSPMNQKILYTTNPPTETRSQRSLTTA